MFYEYIVALYVEEYYFVVNDAYSVQRGLYVAKCHKW